MVNSFASAGVAVVSGRFAVEGFRVLLVHVSPTNLLIIPSESFTPTLLPLYDADVDHNAIGWHWHQIVCNEVCSHTVSLYHLGDEPD